MTIIFAGIHNKKGKQPLDSSTTTGRIIDKIIESVDCECIKTNLFNVDYFPSSNERERLKEEWYWTQLPTEDDIIVLLGNDVQKYFKEYEWMYLNIINATHPAARGLNREEYIKSMVKEIKLTLNK